MATVVENGIAIPFLLVYYTYYLWNLYGWVAPAACYAYFITGAALTAAFSYRIVPLVYRQEVLEGRFRAEHTRFAKFHESIAFLRGVDYERRAADAALAAALDNRWAIVNWHLPLYMVVNWFSYFGAVVNYAVIGIALLFYTDDASKDDDGVVSGLVAMGSYACLYLISAFSRTLSTGEVLMDVMGLASRSAEVLVHLNPRVYAEASHLPWYEQGGASFVGGADDAADATAAIGTGCAKEMAEEPTSTAVQPLAMQRAFDGVIDSCANVALCCSCCCCYSVRGTGGHGMVGGSDENSEVCNSDDKLKCRGVGGRGRGGGGGGGDRWSGHTLSPLAPSPSPSPPPSSSSSSSSSSCLPNEMPHQVSYSSHSSTARAALASGLLPGIPPAEGGVGVISGVGGGAVGGAMAYSGTKSPKVSILLEVHRLDVYCPEGSSMGGEVTGDALRTWMEAEGLVSAHPNVDPNVDVDKEKEENAGANAGVGEGAETQTVRVPVEKAADLEQGSLGSSIPAVLARDPRDAAVPSPLVAVAPLLRNLSFVVSSGDKVLITGPSGSGKTTLLRRLAGLSDWRVPPHVSLGTVSIHVSSRECWFIPQNPYCFAGSLLANLHYPYPPPLSGPGLEDACSSARDALEAVSLGHLLRKIRHVDSDTDDSGNNFADCGAGIGAQGQRQQQQQQQQQWQQQQQQQRRRQWQDQLLTFVDWPTRLSPGERQRVEAARVLLVRPLLLFMDEATSSLDEAAEARVYSALHSVCRGVVSVAHRSSVRSFHTTELAILPSGHVEARDII
jgi:ABC-type uncharacterized transport system fused permease/ATPase subunit